MFSNLVQAKDLPKFSDPLEQFIVSYLNENGCLADGKTLRMQAISSGIEGRIFSAIKQLQNSNVIKKEPVLALDLGPNCFGKANELLSKRRAKADAHFLSTLESFNCRANREQLLVSFKKVGLAGEDAVAAGRRARNSDQVRGKNPVFLIRGERCKTIGLESESAYVASIKKTILETLGTDNCHLPYRNLRKATATKIPEMDGGRFKQSADELIRENAIVVIEAVQGTQGPVVFLNQPSCKLPK